MIEGTEGNVTLQVKDGDTSRIFRRNAVRVSGGATHTTLIGELNGIRAYIRQADGKVTVILSDEDLYQ